MLTRIAEQHTSHAREATSDRITTPDPQHRVIPALVRVCVVHRTRTTHARGVFELAEHPTQCTYAIHTHTLVHISRERALLVLLRVLVARKKMRRIRKTGSPWSASTTAVTVAAAAAAATSHHQHTSACARAPRPAGQCFQRARARTRAPQRAVNYSRNCCFCAGPRACTSDARRCCAF